MSSLRISELAIYPVKSLAQVAVQRARLEAFGLQYDRRWMVVDRAGRFITQRQQARMCLVQCAVDNDALTLSAPDMPALTVATGNSPHTCTVDVWKDRCRAQDCGDEAAQWLSRFLAVDCRLVYFPDDEVRAVDPAYARAGNRTAFSDGFPLLLITQASLDDLNGRLPTPVSMRRFRPNLVITGSTAFAEDSWRRLRIGDITLHVVKPCSRCVIPNIDPVSGERGGEPLRTLTGFRRRDNKVFFGQNLVADGEGMLEVGMPVEVLE